METLHSTTSVEIVVLRMIDKLPKINQLTHTVQLVAKTNIATYTNSTSVQYYYGFDVTAWDCVAAP